MKTAAKYAALAVLATAGLVILGCGEKNETDSATPPAQTGSPAPASTGAAETGGGATSIKTAATVTDGKKDLKTAVCVVCAADGRPHGEEEVKASILYEGKGYYFCSEAEKAEFISNPKKYAVASAGGMPGDPANNR
jgi:YHS domain-containing protein